MADAVPSAFEELGETVNVKEIIAMEESSRAHSPISHDEPAQKAGSHASPAEVSKAERAEHIRQQAVILFDRTRPLHDLGEDSRLILELAARLQNQPIPHARKKPYKAAVAFVKAQPASGLTAEDERVTAAVLAYHQKKIKRKEIDHLDLSPIQVRQVLTITALLRIAVGLGYSGSARTRIQSIEPCDDGLWLVVDGPDAATDAAAAQHNARLWVNIGYPNVEVLESAEAALRLTPFPEPTESIGMNCDDLLSEAGRKVMRYHFARMLSHEEGTRLGEDIEALHDMRVASRRLRAAFEVFQDAFEPGVLKPYLKGLRLTGRALGNVRDLDVFMEKAQQYLDTIHEDRHEGLDLLLAGWREQRETARARMLEWMASQEYTDFKRKFNLFLSTPGAGAVNTQTSPPVPAKVCELSPILIYTRLANVRAYAPYLENAPVELLHALRIEFKKLRYTVEYFQEVLGAQSKEVIDLLKQMQDHLGDLNDAQVAALLLSDFIENWDARQAQLPLEERQPIDEVHHYLAYRQDERQHLMETFQEEWEKRFWQPAFRRYLAQAVSVL
jgi:CHAD domain-containing protein